MNIHVVSLQSAPPFQCFLTRLVLQLDGKITNAALHNDWPISDRYWAISRQKHEMLKCSLTLTILIIIWISIILLFQFNWDFIYSAIIHVSDVSDDPDGIFTCWVQRRSQCPLSMKHRVFALSVVVVDTHRVLRVRETTVRGVNRMICPLSVGKRTEQLKTLFFCQFFPVLKLKPKLNLSFITYRMGYKGLIQQPMQVDADDRFKRSMEKCTHLKYSRHWTGLSFLNRKCITVSKQVLFGTSNIFLKPSNLQTII
jgi:hypothetical protein